MDRVKIYRKLAPRTRGIVNVMKFCFHSMISETFMSCKNLRRFPSHFNAGAGNRALTMQYAYDNKYQTDSPMHFFNISVSLLATVHKSTIQ